MVGKPLEALNVNKLKPNKMAKSTSAADVTFAQNEGAINKTQAQIDHYVPPIIPFVEEKKEDANVIFKLVKHKKGGTHVDGIDDVVGEGGKTERIWLLNGVHSIWQRDLIEIIKDKDFLRTNRRSLNFKNGVCILPAWDTLAIEFARTTRHNIGNLSKNKRKDASKEAFYEYDPAAQQKHELEKRMVRIRAIQEASTVAYPEMQKHASFLGIGFVDELGRPKTEDGIRSEYIMKADADPIYWNETKGTQEVERAFLIKQAIIDSKVDYGNGVIRWAKNGGFICNQPAGKSPQECMLELAMSPTPEGKAFVAMLQTIST